MKSLIKKIQKTFTKKPTRDAFGDLFLRTSAAERTEALRDVARKANEDQRALVREYEKMFPKTAR